MNELIKSLAPSAEESLKHLHLAFMKLNSNANAEALGQLILQKATKLQTLCLEQMFGKRKILDLALAGLGHMKCKDTLEILICKQSDMTDKQMQHIAASLMAGYHRLKVLACEGEREITDPVLVDLVRQYQSNGNVQFQPKAYTPIYV